MLTGICSPKPKGKLQFTATISNIFRATSVLEIMGKKKKKNIRYLLASFSLHLLTLTKFLNASGWVFLHP